ncbi:MAG: DUF5678 domain-containing protein [Verrucomicrobiota bacterium]
MIPKVLVIDDEANVRFALRRQLSSLSCEVLEADNLDEAKRLLSQHRNELRVVVLDLRLVAAEEKEGQESGLGLLKDELVSTQACTDCRHLRFNPNVIVLTAYPNVQSCREAFLAGALDYLGKSDENVWDLLMEKVKQALEHPKETTLFQARKWVEDHYDDLQQKYDGQTVALDGEKVVASANTLEELKAGLRGQKLHPENLLLVTIVKEGT